MIKRRFTWDEAKNRTNQRKHGVGFEEAAQVFDDPLHLSRQDRVEDAEPRWQALGMVGSVALLLVAHTIHETDEDGTTVEVIRIISARRATKRERRRYEHED